MPRVLSRNLKGLIRVKYRGQRLSSPPFSPKRFTHREAVVALLSRPNLHGTSRGEFNFWEAYRPRDYGRQTNYATLEACVNINYHRESRRREFSVRSRKRAFPSSFELVPPSRIIRTVKQSFAFVISTSWICKFSLFKYISGKKNPIWIFVPNGAYCTICFLVSNFLKSILGFFYHTFSAWKYFLVKVNKVGWAEL